MKEFLETLNNTNGDRLFWYGVFILFALQIIGETLVKIFKQPNKNV